MTPDLKLPGHTLMTTLDAAPAASFVTEDNIQVKGY